MDSPGKRLRALIDAPEILVLPGVFDGFSTRLVEQAGYKAAFVTGSGVSEAAWASPTSASWAWRRTSPARARSRRAPTCCCSPMATPATAMRSTPTTRCAPSSAPASPA